MNELADGFSTLIAAVVTAGTGIVTVLGVALIGDIRQKRKLREKQLELASLEVEEKMASMRRRMAADAAAVTEEQLRHASGRVKHEAAAQKLTELMNESAVPTVEGSKLNDLVALGVSELRHASVPTPGAYLLTPSVAPPPDVFKSPPEKKRP